VSFLAPGFALAAVLAAGCGGNKTKDYIPQSNTARSALETFLKAWQSGAAYGPISSSQPAINVFDARWQAGQKLESYEIVEEVAGGEHSQWKVRLRLSGKPDEIESYRVIGIDPLNVFREADYARATGM
jgi:hypothetical protein